MAKGNKDSLGICPFCHESVLYVDDYVKVEDYIKGKIKSTVFFHRNCFRNKINPMNQFGNLPHEINNLMERTNKALGDAGY